MHTVETVLALIHGFISAKATFSSKYFNISDIFHRQMCKY